MSDVSDNRYGREKWDQRWLEKSAAPEGLPDAWLTRVLPWLPAGGTALDSACGSGRHALCLAEAGYRVSALDFSPVALDLLQADARRRGLDVTAIQTDLEGECRLPPGPFDLVIQFYYLYRPLLVRLKELVRPGGYIVIRTFSRAGEDRFGPVSKEISFIPGELLKIFSDWEVLLYEEGLEPSRKGGSLAGILARKGRQAQG